MKDFKEQYYILNTPWRRKLDMSFVQRFDDLNLDDTIVFNYDFMYSVFKTNANGKHSNYDKNIYVSAINVCLRYYQMIKILYPQNKVRVIIHINKLKIYKSYYNIFKSILDLIPNFAVCDNPDLMCDLDAESYKHIIYGDCNKFKPEISDRQKWMVFNGNLVVRY